MELHETHTDMLEDAQGPQRDISWTDKATRYREGGGP